MMKILHLVPLRTYGGAQRSVVQLAAAQRRLGLDAQVIGLYHDPRSAQDAEVRGVPYQTTGWHIRWDFRGWLKLRQIACCNGADILHFHMALLWPFLVLILGSTKKCPWVYHARVYPPPTDTLKDRLLKIILRSKVDAMVGVSKSVTQEIQRYYGSGPRFYKTIYNGTEIGRLAERIEGWPHFMGDISPGRPLVGMATRFAADKGVEEFFDVIPCVLEHLPEARFVLAGEGPLLSWAKEQCAKRQLEKYLILPGFVRDVMKFWESLDVVIFTCPRETFPRIIIEAQSVGTVVAGYLNNSGSDEAILNGETGIQVPWGERRWLAKEIAALWADKEGCARMAMAARLRAEKDFNINNTAEQCLALYNEIFPSASNENY
jgi:glycosyltransferase involved in cell wall biosynthesis